VLVPKGNAASITGRFRISKVEKGQREIQVTSGSMSHTGRAVTYLALGRYVVRAANGHQPCQAATLTVST
jgi:hypothetical protein